MIVVCWGVSGCGKTTIGGMLASALDYRFYDADDYHPIANIEKMRLGKPLTDDDRWPWLAAIANLLREDLANGANVVLACSALRQSYRNALNIDPNNVRFVFLSGSYELISARLAQRKHDFMAASLLQSQFDTLEPSDSGLTLDIAASPKNVCAQIIDQLGLT